jgi:hypothetical protein
MDGSRVDRMGGKYLIMQRFRYRTRTVLLIVTLFAVLFAGMGAYYRELQRKAEERERVMKIINFHVRGTTEKYFPMPRVSSHTGNI